LYSGEIDHFIPKSNPEGFDKIYDWGNYIWSCHTCNNRKLDKYNPNWILNPCDITDCDSIEYKFGEYFLKKNVPFTINEKFRLMQEILKLNCEPLMVRRRAHYEAIFTKLESLNDNYQLDQIFKTSHYQAELEKLKAEIKYKDFKLLIRDVLLPKFEKKYPDFPISAQMLGIK